MDSLKKVLELEFETLTDKNEKNRKANESLHLLSHGRFIRLATDEDDHVIQRSRDSESETKTADKETEAKRAAAC